MKLVSSMFFDPEPNALEISKMSADHDLGQNEYEHYHNDWKRRQMKPEKPRPYKWSKDENSPSFQHDPSRVYDSDLVYYESHRLRWEGFVPESECKDYFNFNFLAVRFHLDGSVKLYYEYHRESFTYRSCSNGMTVQLFELICLENGIELKKI